MIVKSCLSPIHPQYLGRFCLRARELLYHLTITRATSEGRVETLLPRLRAKLSRSALLNTLVNSPHLVLGQAAIVGLKR
jgi:hypothetical protein